MLRKAVVGILFCTMIMTAAVAAAKSNGKITVISALKAMDMLMGDPKTTFLVDVRSRAEYVLQGHPPRAYNVPWRFFSDRLRIKGQDDGHGKAEFTGYQLSPKPNPAFVGVMQSLFKPQVRLILLSTKGTQAAEAAEALIRAGYQKVYVVKHGFLGDPLQSKQQGELAGKFSPYAGQRGRVNGWVFWGLPVTTQVDPRYVYPPDLKRMQSGQ